MCIATVSTLHPAAPKQRLLSRLWLPCALFATHAQAQTAMGFLHPKGWVAAQQRSLLMNSTLIMLCIIIPVIALSLIFAWRYRVTRRRPTHTHYQPQLKDNPLLEVVWWAIPALVIGFLSVLVWISSHRLDPYKSLDFPGKPIHIQVIALPWKWLFLYPEHQVASLNFLMLPVNQPVEFWITADAPMSAFAIPQLGSQIYAMAGMRTRLHLYPTQEGTYLGLNTQFNGAGFPHMHFNTQVVNPAVFHAWLNTAKHTPKLLTHTLYNSLKKPSINNTPTTYHTTDAHLFDWVMAQYTLEQNQTEPPHA